MTEDELLKTLNRLEIGKKIPGTVSGKKYTFAGIREYPGRGRYAHLKGTAVIVLRSAERKRSDIILFFQPLLVLVNSKTSELGFWKLPTTYSDQFRSGENLGIPNLWEYESRYKSLARYIKRLTNTSA